jgi:hypothetical protein
MPVFIIDGDDIYDLSSGKAEKCGASLPFSPDPRQDRTAEVLLTGASLWTGPKGDRSAGDVFPEGHVVAEQEFSDGRVEAAGFDAVRLRGITRLFPAGVEVRYVPYVFFIRDLVRCQGISLERSGTMVIQRLEDKSLLTVIVNGSVLAGRVVMADSAEDLFDEIRRSEKTVFDHVFSGSTDLCIRVVSDHKPLIERIQADENARWEGFLIERGWLSEGSCAVSLLPRFILPEERLIARRNKRLKDRLTAFCAAGFLILASIGFRGWAAAGYARQADLLKERAATYMKSRKRLIRLNVLTYQARLREKKHEDLLLLFHALMVNMPRGSRLENFSWEQGGKEGASFYADLSYTGLGADPVGMKGLFAVREVRMFFLKGRLAVRVLVRR